MSGNIGQQARVERAGAVKSIRTIDVSSQQHANEGEVHTILSDPDFLRGRQQVNCHLRPNARAPILEV